MSEQRAHGVLCKLRWPETNGNPVCPTCGSQDIRDVKNRPNWRCHDCRKMFSLKSVTPFASSQLSYRQIVKLIVAARHGGSARKIALRSKVEYRTAYRMVQIMKSGCMIDRKDYGKPKRGGFSSR